MKNVGDKEINSEISQFSSAGGFCIQKPKVPRHHRRIEKVIANKGTTTQVTYHQLSHGLLNRLQSSGDLPEYGYSTTLLGKDFSRSCLESRLESVKFHYTSLDDITKLHNFHWQTFAFELLQGGFFSSRAATGNKKNNLASATTTESQSFDQGSPLR
jgi:hypothetical protein